jgi:hypothetical protein
MINQIQEVEEQDEEVTYQNVSRKEVDGDTVCINMYTQTIYQNEVVEEEFADTIDEWPIEDDEDYEELSKGIEKDVKGYMPKLTKKFWKEHWTEEPEKLKGIKRKVYDWLSADKLESFVCLGDGMVYIEKTTSLGWMPMDVYHYIDKWVKRNGYKWYGDIDCKDPALWTPRRCGYGGRY